MLRIFDSRSLEEVFMSRGKELTGFLEKTA